MKKLETRRTIDPHALAEAALMADIGVLIALMRFYVPLVGGALHFFEPLPIILLVVRRGARAGLMATIAGCLLTILLAGPSAALWLLRLCANGVVLGAGMRRGWSASRTIALNALLMWLLGIVFLVLTFWIFGIGPEDVRKDTREFWEWLRDTTGWLLNLIDQFPLWAWLHNTTGLLISLGLNPWWQSVIPAFNPGVTWLIDNWLVTALSVSTIYYTCNSIGFYWVAEPLLLRLGISIPHLDLGAFSALPARREEAA